MKDISTVSPRSISELLTRGVAEVIDRTHLEQALASSTPLRIKFGIDPTGTRLHLGHAVPLRILRRFQELGHVVVLVIGDFTAGIGDPSGKNETRPPLSPAEIKKNYATYEKQAFLVLDKKHTEVRWQSEWFGKMKLKDVITEASKLSAGWIYSHDTFRDRLKNGQPLAMHETFYPLLQAYDSIAVKADVEMGGMDQKFNLLTGRELMRAHGIQPQDIVLAKYLMGTDGQKMGKSLHNFIAVEEESGEMFGKIMSMPDTVLRDYFELATDVPTDEIDAMKFEDVAARDAKLKLAETVVGMYHGMQRSKAALDAWKSGFGKDLGTATAKNNGDLREMLVTVGVAKSKGEAQRMIEQGGLQVDGKVEKDWRKKFSELGEGERVIVVGKKKQTLTIEGE